MRKIVNGLLVRGGNVLLACRSPQRKAYAGRWSFPGGHVEENESFADALARELREEIGLTPIEFGYLETIVDPNCPPTGPAIYCLYSVTPWQGGEPRLIGDEHTELRWFSLRDATNLAGLALEDYRAVFHKLANG